MVNLLWHMSQGACYNGADRDNLHFGAEMSPGPPPPRWWHRLRDLFAHHTPAEPDVDLPRDFLELLDRLRVLSVRATGTGLRQGHRLGAYRGGQLEFHDYRAYVHGDNLRYLDWNLYARMEKAFIKEFAREEAGAVYLLLDATPSMALGRPSKWTFSRRLAALFAHVAWTEKDMVRALVFHANGSPPATFPPKGSHGNTTQLLDWLRRQTLSAPRPDIHVQPQSPIGEGIRQFLSTNPRRGRVFLLSDFWDEEQTLTTAFHRLTSAGLDLSVVHILSPEEIAPPIDGDWRIMADEEPGEIELALAPSVRTRYSAELEQHRATLEALLRRRGASYLFAPSNTSLERVLIQTLRQKQWVG